VITVGAIDLDPTVWLNREACVHHRLVYDELIDPFDSIALILPASNCDFQI
jgi:hypothetical protein